MKSLTSVNSDNQVKCMYIMTKKISIIAMMSSVHLAISAQAIETMSVVTIV